MSILASLSSSRQQLGQENIVRALCVNALPLARQQESRYRIRWPRRTACHGHVSLYVTANTGIPAGREIMHIMHFPGVRVLCLILFCFCICFVFSIMYCATLGPTDFWLRHVLSCSIPFPCVFFLSMPLTPLCSSLSQSVCILISRPLVPSLLRSITSSRFWFNRKF